MRTEQPKRCSVFNGTTSYINCGDVCNFTNNFSISAWVKLASAAHTMVASRREGVITQYGIGTHANQGVTVYCNSASATSAVKLVLNQWHLVTAVWKNAGDVAIYIDGVLESTNALTAVTSTSSNLEVGRRATSGGFQFPGKLFDLQVLPIALTDDQVAKMHQLGSQALAGVDRSLWLKLDSLNTSLSYDSSGNAQHGTPTDITYAEDANLPYSYQNDVGYTLDGSIYVPRDESDTNKDVLGNTLQFSGPA